MDTTLPRIERLDFFNGERLFAEDLQTLDGFNRQMRWLHNFSLHTFGIGSGFVVQGKRGDREVTVSPGYAIDNAGREIILLTMRTETVPPVADDGLGNPQFYDLTVHYPPTVELEELETRSGVCGTNGVVRRREEPLFCWIELKGSDHTPKNPKHAVQIAVGEKIVLARVSVKNCQLETLTIANRRTVRPDTLPYVACGKMFPQKMWRPWTITIDEATQILGVEATVDTSAAHFSGVPCYTARAAGIRVFRISSVDQPVFLVEGFPIVEGGATPTGFVFRVFLPEFSTGVRGEIPVNPRKNFEVILQSIQENWYIEWMGVEG
jgi:hypothetical protein